MHPDSKSGRELEPLLPITQEKKSDDTATPQPDPKSKPRRTPFRDLSLAKKCFIIGFYVWMGSMMVRDIGRISGYFKDSAASPSTKGVCAQVDALRPSHPVSSRLRDVYGASNFTDRVAFALSGAVKVPTEVFDTNGPVGVDAKWEVFALFHEYLQATFPKTHVHLSLTKVNTHGLLYEWKGSDDTLKPILLMAHQDVVPVDPAVYSQWTEPPYSGAYKDGWVWGRGSVDDKAGLIGIMLTVETLLEQGFKPKRSILLSFGFDEEASGSQGAAQLAGYIAAQGIKEFAMIVDEGGGVSEEYGATMALPDIAEKGYMDLKLQVNTAGGHSSIPPKHTSIGYLALLIAQIEAHSRPTQLKRDSPIFQTLECAAAHGPDMPSKFKKEILKAATGGDKALRTVKEMILKDSDNPKSASIISILSTTQAVDIVSGGIKSNALPEETFAIVNHRIDLDSSIAELQNSIISLVGPIAEKYNLELIGFDGSPVNPRHADAAPAVGTVTISDAYGTALEPAPKTPTDSAAYRLLSGTIRAAWAQTNPDGGDVIVAPSMMGGNTDTKYYWDLSQNIFRYGHTNVRDMKNGVHTINEALRAEGLVSIVTFFSTLVLNADESTEI